MALDLSGRPYLHYEVEPGGEALGMPPFDPQLAEEFWRAFVTSAAITLHLRMRSGKNTHHILEASFKGVARALRDAVRVEGGGRAVHQGHALTPDSPMIAVLDYGIGNLRSAQKALQRVGADAVLTDDVGRGAGGRGVVLPGVGPLRAVHGGAAGRRAWRTPAREAIEAGTPFLGICVGMQMLYEGSEEDPDVKGMGVLPGTVRLPARRGQAPADAVERARPRGRRAAARRPRRPGVGLLRPLLRPRDDRRRGRHLRLRRPGGGRRPAGQPVGHPVPPREVGRGRAAHPGQLRGRLSHA